MVNASLDKCVIQAIQVDRHASSNIVLEKKNLPTIMNLCASESTRTSDKDAELLNRQFPFGIDLNKILPVVGTKAEKPDIHFYIPVSR